MDAIPFEMTPRDFMIAGKIRRGIRNSVADRNARELQAASVRAQVAPSASPDVKAPCGWAEVEA